MEPIIKQLVSQYLLFGVLLSLPIITIYTIVFAKRIPKTTAKIMKKVEKQTTSTKRAIELKNNGVIKKYIFGLFGIVAGMTIVASSFILAVFLGLSDTIIYLIITQYYTQIIMILIISIFIAIIVLYSISVPEAKMLIDKYKNIDHELSFGDFYLTIKNILILSGVLSVVILMITGLLAWF